MPDNLWEFANEFRIIDVEGVILDNPNDFIIIREPVGMSEVNINLVRDEDTHGVDYEFSDAETPFGFDNITVTGQPYSAWMLLLGIYDEKGVDAKAVLELRNEGQIPEIQYQANLDFETIDIGEVVIKLTARRITSDDLFRTRYETPVSLQATETIDGVSVTPPIAEDMFLHGRKRLFQTVADLDIEENQIANLQTTGGTLYCNLILNNTTLNGIPGFQYQSLVLTGTEVPMISSQYGGLLTIVDLNLEWQAVGVSLANFDYELQLVVKAGENGIEYPLGTPISGNGLSYNQVMSVSETGLNLEVPVLEPTAGETSPVFMYVKIYYASGTPSTSVGVAAGGVGNINMNFDTSSSGSNSDVYNTFDSVDHVLSMITNQTGVLNSFYLQGATNEIYLTGGSKIRRLPQKAVEPSFKDLFDEWIQPTFALGFSTYEDEGDFKISMERYQSFYRDYEIDYFDSTVDGSFSITIDKDIYFNEIITGYKNYPKSTDENKGNNIDEYNTQHNHITPLKTIRNKKEYVSSTITSGYLIENQRIEQFKDKPSDTISYDENLFCIKGITSDKYFGVTAYSPVGFGFRVAIEGTWYDLKVGDSITIQQGFTFVSLIIDTINIEGNETILRPTIAVASFSITGATLTLPVARLRAERNDNVDILNNVTSPETIYNVGLNPKTMLFNQSPIFNSGLNRKPDNAEVKTQRTFLNGEMEFSFEAGGNDYSLIEPSQTIKMNDPLELADIAGNQKLFSGEMITFTTKIPYSRVLALRSKHNDPYAAVDNYGYIRVKNPKGGEITGWLMSMTYNPMSEMVDFRLRGRFVPEGGRFDYVIEEGLN